MSVKSFLAKQLFLAAKRINPLSTNNNRKYWNDFFLSPSWVKISGTTGLEWLYNTLGVVAGIINIKADSFANMEVVLKDIKTGEIIPATDPRKMVQKFYTLMGKPNPLQSTFELLRQAKVYHDLFGDAYLYAAAPVGAPINLETIYGLTNVPSQHVKIEGTGKYFDQTEISEIIKKYIFKYGGKSRDFTPETILHRNDINISFDESRLQGRARLLGYTKEISNILAALESRNVLMKKRGALGIFTSDAKDASGSVSLSDPEKKEAQEALEGYGTLDSQDQFMLSKAQLKYQQISSDPAKLQLLENEWNDVISIANGFGVPDILVKLWITGSTFENQKEGLKRLYQQAIIPEAKDFMIGLNEFLKLKDFGFVAVSSFDHISALQENKKDEAVSDRNTSMYLQQQFFAGAIIYNEWRTGLGQPAIDDPIGEMRIWDLTPEQLEAIKKV